MNKRNDDVPSYSRRLDASSDSWDYIITDTTIFLVLMLGLLALGDPPHSQVITRIPGRTLESLDRHSLDRPTCEEDTRRRKESPPKDAAAT